MREPTGSRNLRNWSTEELNTKRQADIQERMGVPSGLYEDDSSMGGITITLQKEVYMPGEEVNGTARISLDKPVSQRSAVLYLIGKEKTEVSYQAGKYRATAREEREFLHKELALPLPIGEKGKLTPGVYTIPFRYVLPDRLLPSYNGSRANVVYEVNAKIDVPLGSDINESTPFEVVPGTQSIASEGIDVCSDEWNNPDMAGLSVILDKCEYARGEVISGKCSFRNPHLKDLRKIDVSLKWTEAAQAKGHDAESKMEEQTAEVPLRGKVAQGTDSFSIQIPQEAPITFDGSLCSVGCILRIGLDIAFGSDVRAEQAIAINGSPSLVVSHVPHTEEKSGYASKGAPEPAYPPEGAKRLPTSLACQHCGTPIVTPTAKYCPSCGSRLDTQTKEVPAPIMQPKMKIKSREPRAPSGVEHCIVCGRDLGQNDDVVWCPHCGKLAHREHLIDWIQSKGTCPACGQRLDETQYR